jgi:hypothetical protein
MDWDTLPPPLWDMLPLPLWGTLLPLPSLKSPPMPLPPYLMGMVWDMLDMVVMVTPRRLMVLVMVVMATTKVLLDHFHHLLYTFHKLLDFLKRHFAQDHFKLGNSAQLQLPTFKSFFPLV